MFSIFSSNDKFEGNSRWNKNLKIKEIDFMMMVKVELANQKKKNSLKNEE